jgi:hypothetical protein
VNLAHQELRHELQAAGAGLDVIAAEFARRYDLRPRAAWRHAHGWSLMRVTEYISECAASVDPQAGGPAAAMRASDLSEVENWPNNSGRKNSRKPTPYVLALLARVYGTDIWSLLDSRDYEHMSPEHRLIIEEFRRHRVHLCEGSEGGAAYCLGGSVPAANLGSLSKCGA